MSEKTVRHFGFAQFRFVVAGILLLAAGLKAWQLATIPLPPVAQDGFFTPLLELLNNRYLLMAVVVGEILFALILIAGIWKQWTWLLSLLAFSAFTLVSLMKGLSGESSCGCFGTVAVNPWITTCFDLIIVVLLAIFRERLDWSFPPLDKKRVAAVLIVWFVLAGSALFAMLSLKEQPQTTLGTEFIGVDGKITLMLEPNLWIGKSFPLWDRVDDTSRAILEKGEWDIVIGRKQCEECKRLIEILVSQTTNSLAVLEIDEDSADSNSSTSQASVSVKGTVKIEPHWVILTPCLMKCRDGVCISIETPPFTNE